MEEREELRPWQPAALAHSSGSIPSTEVIRLFHKAEQRNRVDRPANVESRCIQARVGDYRPSRHPDWPGSLLVWAAVFYREDARPFFVAAHDRPHFG